MGQRAGDPPGPPGGGEKVDDSVVYALYQQGCNRLSGGHPRAAAEVLELAVEHAPHQASLHETLGRAYFATARLQAARASFAATLELEPSNDFAHFGMGRCFERQGRLPDAAKHYKLACAMADRTDYRDALARVQLRLEAPPGHRPRR